MTVLPQSKPGPRVIEHRARLATGLLHVRASETRFRFDDLVGFAARDNPRRGFLFVSKVLGKHYPSRPAAMQAIHRALARALTPWCRRSSVFVGMAETATGLGQGVHEAFSALTGVHTPVFIHSTRYRLSGADRIEFQESHSHATDIYLHIPSDSDLRTAFLTTETLVLVDDEISTGETAVNLLQAYGKHNPLLARVVIATILNLTSADHRQALAARVGLPIHFVSIIDGAFRFMPDVDYRFTTPIRVTGNGACKRQYLSTGFGRLGLCRPLRLDLSPLETLVSTWRRGSTVLVLGTGEFMHPPFHIGLYLECRGFPAAVQSTTRSPILLGQDVGSVLSFEDNYGDGIPNFLYNVRPEQYDRVLVCHETPPGPGLIDLAGRLNAPRLDLHDGKISIS
ncbi:MAG: phosphoribosyltransferase domain-containing protein [Gammaproteobacteria bacterium]